jgi:pimeloyl-ACP methyl ester carboxylesterase
MSTFVLVHGAWHGAWCWYKIIPRLEKLRHRVLAPDSQSHGLDRTPPLETTFRGIVEGICRVVDSAPEPIVLVGHSFGGMVITQAAEERADKIKCLIYVAAFLPQNGQSVLDLNQNDPETLMEFEFLDEGRLARAKPDKVRDIFYGDCSDEDVALARLLLVSDGVEPYGTPVSTTAAKWGGVPRTYIECTRDRAIGISRQRAMQAAMPCRRSFTLDTDHSPFFSAPDALVRCLTEP